MSHNLWTQQELDTAERIYGKDLLEKRKFLNALLTHTKEERQAVMERLNKSTWRHLLEIFGLGAYGVGAVVRQDKDANIIAAIGDNAALECGLKNDLVFYENTFPVALKVGILLGAIVLLNKL